MKYSSSRPDRVVCIGGCLKSLSRSHCDQSCGWFASHTEDCPSDGPLASIGKACGLRTSSGLVMRPSLFTLTRYVFHWLCTSRLLFGSGEAGEILNQASSSI